MSLYTRRGEDYDEEDTWASLGGGDRKQIEALRIKQALEAAPLAPATTTDILIGQSPEEIIESPKQLVLNGFEFVEG